MVKVRYSLNCVLNFVYAVRHRCLPSRSDSLRHCSLYLAHGLAVLIPPAVKMSSDSLEDQRLSYAADMVVAVTFGSPPSVNLRRPPLTQILHRHLRYYRSYKHPLSPPPSQPRSLSLRRPLVHYHPAAHRDHLVHQRGMVRRARARRAESERHRTVQQPRAYALYSGDPSQECNLHHQRLPCR